MSQHIDPEVKQSFIVDNLTTNDAGKALSAAQGYILNNNNYPIGKGDIVSTSVNFNDYVTPGIKTFVSNASVSSSTNKPSNYGGRLVVWSSSGGALNTAWAAGGQIYIDFVGNQILRSANANASGTIEWSAWNQLASNSSVNTLNGNIAKMGQPAAESSTYSSLDNFKSGLISIVSGMNNGEVRKIRFAFSVTSIAPFKGYNWTCEITRGNASYFSGIAYTYGLDVNAVEIKYSNGTWYIEEFAKKSDIHSRSASTNIQEQRVALTADNGAKIEFLVGKLNSTQNYLQFFLNDIDRGYLVFDVSRNII